MERISVAIRVRPPTKEELVKGNHWVIEENKVTLCNCYGAPLSGYSYAFDRLFASESNNADVYEIHAKEVVLSAMRGFNGTVFAYGQTSSGKTYTMQGNDAQPGIIPLAVRDVFNSIAKTGDREFLVRVSYMEIYNEEINDLLAPENRKLQIHENFEKGVFVAGLREEIVNTPDQVYDFLKLGEAHRHFAETNMNLYSSRSHTIFRMVIESRDKNRDTDAVRVSTLNMVDLAGSERVAKTGAGGVRLKEGGHINKSLMTLGTVINKLSEGTGKGVHIPYRDSKVTRILQPALDGNAKTAIICTITPDEIHIDETKGTLQFASRAKKVATCAHVNEILTDAAVLKRQKKEIEELRQKLLGLRSDDFEKQLLKLRNDLLKYELEKEKLALELEEERKTQVERELKIKEQEQRIENLSTLVLSSARDDRDHLKDVKMVSRRETWSPQKVMPDASIKDYFRSPLARIDSSLISTRRNRDKSVTPLPAFEALLEHQDDTLGNGPPALNGLTELSQKDSDEDTWMHLNEEGANVADEDTWTRLNDDEWASLNSEQQIVSTSHEYTPCVKSDKVDLLEFQLKELQVQLEELQHRFSCKDAEAADLKRQLNISMNNYEETLRQLEEMRKENCNLHELNLQLDSERCAQERRILETEQQKSQIMANNDQLIKKLADLQAENEIDQRQLEELKDANLILDRDASDAKEGLNEVMREKERSEQQLASLLSVLRDENRRLDSLLTDSHLEKQHCVKQLDDLTANHVETEKQLRSLLAENSHLQEIKKSLETKFQFHEGVAAQVKEELQQQLLINNNLMETNKDLDSLVQTARLQEQQAMQQVTDMVAENKKLVDSNKVMETQLHEVAASITGIKEQHKRDQECLIERLHMSEQHISVLEEQLYEVRADRDRLSGIVSVQVERNQEILTAMRLERVRVARELSKYLGALTCQQDSISAVCSGINSIVQA